ncbi:hypothetical protein [Thalassolituus maritimus]|uniref:Transmembrane protein n=1 Tax=Thalassolituus maritimus TaxID=484498 RepID=A0ABP9ZWH8_9GAMM
MDKTNTGSSGEDSSKRELRKLLYCIVGVVLILGVLYSSFGGVLSFMALSKFEILLLVGVYFLSNSNTALDRQVNIDWFSPTRNEVNIGWLHSKVTDLSWVGIAPFYIGLLTFLSHFLDESSSEKPATVDGLLNNTTVSAVLLIYVVSVLVLRNAYLRFQLSRMKSKSLRKPKPIRKSEPTEVTSESTEKEEVSNG